MRAATSSGLVGLAPFVCPNPRTMKLRDYGPPPGLSKSDRAHGERHAEHALETPADLPRTPAAERGYGHHEARLARGGIDGQLGGGRAALDDVVGEGEDHARGLDPRA